MVHANHTRVVATFSEADTVGDAVVVDIGLAIRVKIGTFILIFQFSVYEENDCTARFCLSWLNTKCMSGCQ